MALVARTVLGLAIGLCVATAVVGHGFAMASRPAEIRIGEADEGRTISLSIGQRLAVALPYVAGTGYSWALESEQPAAIAFEGSSVIAQSNLPGGRGEQVLTFVARAPAHEHLELVYRRVWEKGVTPLKRFSVTLDVKAE